MDQRASPVAAYICPMHSGVREERPGNCPICGMSLVPEGTSFALLRHLLSNRMHLTVMIAVMLALMAAAMMLMR
jgi:Cu+-exporting ATPase